MTNTYLAVDLEYAWDEQLYEAHRAFDRKSNRRATAVHRITAAAVFEFTVGDHGEVSTGAVLSWNQHQWGDEQAVVAELFNYLSQHQNLPVLTFGGLGKDIPVLVLAAIAYGIPLPFQLRDQPGRKGPRPHLDLGLMLKGGGRTWSHLSQVLLRQGVPANLLQAKPKVEQPQDPAGWQRLSDHCELDCLLLAIAKVGWLRAQGQNGLDIEPAIIGLIAGFLRRRPDHALHNRLVDYANMLEQRIAERYDVAC
tara:strand:- start:6364 stop:7119 length:756 start_codon:yes stop_codon:yes gene_type:complete